jgi:prepilin-type N-terminal cleavage/methylation domain-containing protein
MRMWRGVIGERGFTVIEVLVAMVLSLTVITALSAAFVIGNNGSLGGQRQVQLLPLAQQQLENVRQASVRYGFADVFLNASPGSPDATIPQSPLNPDDYVNTSTTPWDYYIEENYNNNGGNISTNVATGTPSTGEPLIIGTASTSTPGIAPISSSVAAGGGGTATVYTFITKVNDACNSALTSTMGGSSCSTTAAQQDLRRVVVAVLYNNPTSQTPHAPEYATTILSNPVPSNQVNSHDGLRLGVNIGALVGVGS